MCDVFSITALAVSAATSAAQYEAQANAARKQAGYQNQMYKDASRIGQESYQEQTGTVAERLIQNGTETGQQAESNAAAAMQARARVNVAGAEAGIEGGSVDALLGDFRRQETMNRDSLLLNQRWAAEQAFRDEKGIRAQTESNIANRVPAPVQMPSTIGLGLSLAGAGLGAYNSYLKNQPPNPNTANNRRADWSTSSNRPEDRVFS